MTATLYTKNSFRILELPGNATSRQIRDTYQRLRQRANLGQLDEVHGLPFFLLLRCDEETIRRAFNRLENPDERICERLFWFDLMSKTDQRAFTALEQGNVQQAIRLWEAVVWEASKTDPLKDEYIVATHNLAVLKHMLSIVEDPEGYDSELWNDSFGHWSRTIEENYCVRLWNVESMSGYDSISYSEFMENMKNIWQMILEPNQCLAKEAIDSSNYPPAKNHLSLIRSSGFPEDAIRKTEDTIIGPLEKRIEEHSSRIRNGLPDIEQLSDLSAKKIACDQAYESFHREVMPLLKGLLEILDGIGDEKNHARNEVSKCLREIAIYYNNQVEAYKRAEEMLKEALELAGETSAADKIKVDLKIVSNKAEQERQFEQQLSASEALRERIQQQCSEIYKKLLEVREIQNPIPRKKVCDKAYQQFLTMVMPLFHELLQILDDSDDAKASVQQELSLCLRNIAIYYNNYAEDPVTAERRLMDALALANGTPAFDGIREDLAKVSQYAEEQRRRNSQEPIAVEPGHRDWRSSSYWILCYIIPLAIGVILYIIPGENSRSKHPRKQLQEYQSLSPNPYTQPPKAREIPSIPYPLLDRKEQVISQLKREAERLVLEGKSKEEMMLYIKRRLVEEGFGRKYVVGPGDTLSSIAKNLYGKPSLWKKIFDANRDKLRDPNHLELGMELYIPE